MELKPFVTTVLKWSWLIVLATLLAAGVTYRSASRIPRVYQASTTLFVGHTLQTLNPNPGDIETSRTLAQSYVQLVRSQPVLQGTIDTLHLNMSWADLSPEVTGLAVSGTETIQILVVDAVPQRAALIANELARQLILQSPTPRVDDPARQFTNEQMQQLQGQIKTTQSQITDLQKRADQETSARTLQDLRNQINVLQQKVDAWQNTYTKLSDFYQGSRINYLSVVQPATIPTAPVGTSMVYNVALAGAIGFALALGGIILLEFLDDTLKTQKDVRDTLKLPILGGIGRVRSVRTPGDQLFVLKAPQSSEAEAFRLLSTNVYRGAAAKSPVTLLVSSPGPAEGKSTIVANLAVSLAQVGTRVIAVDANLRRPSLHRIFDVANREGLTSLLENEQLDLNSVLQRSSTANLKILPSGPLPANPGSLLGSEAMIRLLAQLREQADVVIVDSPAVLAAADATLLGLACDATILVVRARRTRRPVTKQAVAALGQVGLAARGLIFNEYDLGRRSYQQYYAIPVDSPVRDVQQQCPFVGLRTDPSSVFLASTAEHRCHATQPPAKIEIKHQVDFCLADGHTGCPRWAAAQSRATVKISDQVRLAAAPSQDNP